MTLPDGPPAVRGRAASNSLRALLRAQLLGAYTAYCQAGYLARYAITPESRRRAAAVEWEHRWFRHGAKLAGLTVTCEGPLPEPGSFIAPNHFGYADIIALGGVCKTFFVAKVDVEGWPVIGYLFKTSYQIGVPRSVSKGIKIANERIAECLNQGHSVCVFLEGTSSGGGEVLPFHAPLVQPAIETNAPIVPTAIRWSATTPTIDIGEDVAYWRPEHTFAPHLWRLLGLNGVSAHIRFGQPVEAAGRDRKDLAAEIREHVLALLHESAPES